jgi:hypothetical protein
MPRTGSQHRERSRVTLAEFRRLLDDLETASEVGPDTRVFVDCLTRGLQDPVLSTSEKSTDGARVLIIETPKDTIDEVI